MKYQVSECRKAGILTIIQSTHASLKGLKTSGLLGRYKRLLAEYNKIFHVVLYSSDTIDYSTKLCIEHHPMPWLPSAFGLHHALFYFWLVLQAPRMKGVIKVFGSNIPVLPFIRFLSGRKMVVTYQWSYAEQSQLCKKSDLRYWLGGLFEWLALKSADFVLVTTKRLQNRIKSVYRKRTFLSPNWVDLSEVNKINSSILRSKSLILYAGRLHRIKGIDYLINAFAVVKKRHPKASLVICGVGNKMEQLKSKVRKLGVEDIKFKGSVPNEQVLNLMKSSAIFVLPTITMEGHPKALVEAMACGAACIATDVPGNKDIIINRKNGLLVPPKDVQALAAALSQLLANHALRAALSENARKDALPYNWDIIVPKEVYFLLSLAFGKRWKKKR